LENRLLVLEYVRMGAFAVDLGLQLSKSQQCLLVSILRVGEEEVVLFAVDLLSPTPLLLGTAFPPVDFKPDAIRLALLGIGRHQINLGWGDPPWSYGRRYHQHRYHL